MITVDAKKVGMRVIATVKVGIGIGQYTYTVQFADQGSEAANEAEAQREPGAARNDGGWVWPPVIS